MPFAGINHLVIRGPNFYFRRAFPKHVGDLTGRRELKLSLLTQDLRIAKIRCRSATNCFERLLWGAQAMPELTREKLDDLICDYFSTR